MKYFFNYWRCNSNLAFCSGRQVSRQRRYPVEDSLELKAAVDAGYHPIVGCIKRTDIVDRNWENVETQISFGKRNGCSWFYVDDGLSGGNISKGQIDTVAVYVHNSPLCLLATSEYDSAIMINNPHWHDNVDIIMPYQYTSNYSVWYDFVSFVYNNYSGRHPIVPILGWNAIVGGFIFQKGSNSGDLPFIETAQSMATLNIIVYYAGDNDYNGNTGNMNDLTTYLTEYNYLQGHLLP